MAIKYKQKCAKCKKNYVIVTWKQSYPICYDCQQEQMKGEIADSGLKKLLDIPEQYYKENSFLRSIKINAIQYGKLSEKQIETFKKAVEKLKGEKKEENKEETTKSKYQK
jgi:cyclophilin family peptidyl-prolyl cis-trans isomerase